jgi:hypothetical protein
MITDLLGFGRGVEILAEDLGEGEFRHWGPRFARMASVDL